MSKCKCGNVAPQGQRKCLPCHATYMRSWRQVKQLLGDGILTGDSRIRDIARSKLAMRIKRGAIIRPEFCSVCKLKGEIQAHHKDYEKPYDVVWLCKECHNKHHSNETTLGD